MADYDWLCGDDLEHPEGTYFTARVAGHRFSFLALAAFGINTGRRRWMVRCDTCGELIHEATTGPTSRVRDHLRRVGIVKRGAFAQPIHEQDKAVRAALGGNKES